MLLVVSPNLCLDRVVVVHGFGAGVVSRAASATAVAGGKGMNVARVAASLGMSVRVAGFAGGTIGRQIVTLARSDGIPLDVARVRDESRICTLIVDPGRNETVINEPGARVGAREIAALRVAVRRRISRAQAVVLSGSIPPGMPAAWYAGLIRLSRGRLTLLDTSGPSLRAGVAARPVVVKVNRDELAEFSGRSLRTLQHVRRAAREVQHRGAGSALVTLGEDGLVVASAGSAWHLRPPRVARVNAIGAGDSLTAGFVVGMLRGWRILDAARLGVAAAAADVATLWPGHVRVRDVRRLFGRVAIREVAD